MTAGKLIQTLKSSNGPILSLNFNPNEFVLASCSVDGSTRVFDLQTFEEISCYTDAYAEKIIFSNDGLELLACCQTSLQVLGWEPISLVREIPVQWNQVNSTRDFKILPDTEKGIACVTNGNYIDVWGFQLKKVHNHLRLLLIKLSS